MKKSIALCTYAAEVAWLYSGGTAQEFNLFPLISFGSNLQNTACLIKFSIQEKKAFVKIIKITPNDEHPLILPSCPRFLNSGPLLL